MMKKVYLNELTKGKTDTGHLDMNANRLKTEEQKIHWLENEIKDLEYVLSFDCINRNLKLNQLQMYREHLDMLKNNQTETKLELEEEKILTMCNIACEEFFKQPAVTDILKMAPVENLAHDIAEELVTRAWSLLKADETNKMLNKGVDSSITSTSLEGEDNLSDQAALDEIKVRVLDLNLCEASNDPDLVARADVEVMNDTSFLRINSLDLRYNDATKEYSIVEPKTPSGVCLNRLARIAVINVVVAHYEQIKHSDEIIH